MKTNDNLTLKQYCENVISISSIHILYCTLYFINSDGTHVLFVSLYINKIK